MPNTNQLKAMGRGPKQRKGKRVQPHHVLMGLAGVLGVVLAVQIAVILTQNPGKVYFVSWAYSPDSLDEAVELSQAVVLAKVTGVQPGDDLTLDAPGEPNNQDRIPTQVVALQVQEVYLGNFSDSEFKLFQTGLFVNGPINELPPPPADQAPPPPEDAVPRPDNPPKRTELESRTTLLEDDPPYQVGQIYVLFLTGGPAGLMRPISPEGRFLVLPDETLQPATNRKFAGKLRGKPLSVLVDQLQGRSGAPDPSLTIENALDQNTNGLIDDAEALAAIQLWITGEEVPGTDGRIIDDASMLQIIEMWVSGRPIPLEAEV